MKKLQSEFESLVKDPSSPTAGESLKQVALAVWYEKFVPDVKDLSGLDASQAGFILDKLCCYHCLADEQSALIRSQLLPGLKKRSLASTNEVRDQLAREWGAPSELKPEFRALLPYQRRVYRHTHSASSD